MFGGDEARHTAYVQAKTALANGEAVEVVIRSNDPQFLGLPWELLKAPDESEPLSVAVGSFDRSLLLQEPARPFPAMDREFRVLMVIARPEGTGDVPFQAVARPLFRHLERHHGPVKIEVLRPPSFAAFRQMLLKAKQEGRPYHAVHFDGHGAFGVLAPRNGKHRSELLPWPEGVLLFEQEAGGADEVKAADFAAGLEGRRRASGDPQCLPVRGRSMLAAGTAGPEAGIATKLLQEGAASVIAMSHSVYVVAAAAFMGAFYEQLLAGQQRVGGGQYRPQGAAGAESTASGPASRARCGCRTGWCRCITAALA